MKKPTSSSTSASNGLYYTDIYVRTKNGYWGHVGSPTNIYFVAITLNKNNGTGSVTGINSTLNRAFYTTTTSGTYYCPYGMPCTLPTSVNVHKNGYYNMNGLWNSNSIGTGTSYSPSSTYSFTAATTLYTTWYNYQKGYYCNTVGRYACADYRDNTTTTTTTASSYDSCVCDAGWYLSGETCVQCATGTYKSNPSNLVCTTASTGYYVDTVGADIANRMHQFGRPVYWQENRHCKRKHRQ